MSSFWIKKKNHVEYLIRNEDAGLRWKTAFPSTDWLKVKTQYWKCLNIYPQLVCLTYLCSCLFPWALAGLRTKFDVNHSLCQSPLTHSRQLANKMSGNMQDGWESTTLTTSPLAGHSTVVCGIFSLGDGCSPPQIKQLNHTLTECDIGDWQVTAV